MRNIGASIGRLPVLLVRRGEKQRKLFFRRQVALRRSRAAIQHKVRFLLFSYFPDVLDDLIERGDAGLDRFNVLGIHHDASPLHKRNRGASLSSSFASYLIHECCPTAGAKTHGESGRKKTLPGANQEKTWFHCGSTRRFGDGATPSPNILRGH